jgi:hypothetical protein
MGQRFRLHMKLLVAVAVQLVEQQVLTMALVAQLVYTEAVL